MKVISRMKHGLKLVAAILCFSELIINIDAQTIQPTGVSDFLNPISVTGTEGRPGICPQGKYGENCEYECHCPVGTECDPTTGQCPDVCAPGWSGAPYCQAENVALHKQSYQHGTYLGWNASRAVDGNPDQDGTYGSCAWAHNGDDVFKTWWNVDLGANYTIQSIEIYFRTDDAMSQSRRAGVRIYVSASIEEAKNEGLCYMDQMNDFVFPPPHLILRDGSLTCAQRRGRFVIMYVDRPTQTSIRNCPEHTLYSCWANLELCEVQIFACTNGTFGNACQNRCHCRDNAGCDGETGACDGVCQAGWEGNSCDTKCQRGRYGVNCNMTCGRCLDTVASCDRRTGTCKACQSGWTGSKCEQPCEPGTYGTECRGKCGNCIGTCDPQTGVCSLGCKPGWVDSKCTEVCVPGTYGPSCESNCANCREGAACNHVTGYCPAGCAVGFVGNRCKDVCKSGQYGVDCLQVCGKCRDNTQCDHVTGNCPSGCADGWRGGSCQTVCPAGSYGNQCSGECGVCKGGKPCNHETGLCTDGCSEGWDGEKCKNRCQPGHYGVGCLENCGACKNGDPCHHVTGLCASGCSVGWRGDACRQGCEKGFYGDECNKSCGFCRNKTACNHIDGLCQMGCEPEYYGEFCVLSLSISENEDKSEATSLGGDDTDLSVLIGGVMAGVVVAFLGIMLFVVIRRRNNTPRERPAPKSSQRRDTHTNVELVHDNGHINPVASSHASPTPSRASSLATIKTNCTQSHITIDDQEVLYVNLKKKHPTPLPLPVPSPKLSTFQRKVVHTDVHIMEPTYYNMKEELARQEGGIPVKQFSKYLRDMETNKNSFKEAFSQYAHGLKFPHEAGKRPRNKFKNRFAQMFPYDHSRVVLDDDPSEPDSDYINANFIDSVDYPNCYIATQGPNKITLKDFWNMVWQNKCGKIVMLTNLVEESKNKCERYWPNERVPLSFGDLQIQLAQSQEHPFYTLRFMTLTSKQNPEDVRTIKHFHFTAWPDHGVPDTFEIVSFFKCVLRTPINLPGPMLVHCSAGVGRTGTFISLDAMYHYGKRGGNIDIPTFVHKMRQQRMNMIQTIDQYRLLHYALQEALGYGDTTLSSAAFHSECLRHIEDYNAGQQNRIIDEFQKLEELKPKLGNENFLAALRKENVEKNRSLNVLAADKYRPYLSTYVADTTDYINAVVVPSRNNKMGYVASQLPLKNTIIDFWRLIYDHSSNIIVALHALDEDQEDACAWWPSLGDSITFGPLVVETLAVETPRTEVTERTFRILRKGIKDSKLVYMITYNEWMPGKYLPCSVDSFLVLLGRVNLYRKSFPDSAITVLCLDGVACSGVFVSTNNVLDQVVQDQEVDVFNTVRQIQLRRPQFIKNKDQYLFIYQSICKYIESMSSIYGNIS